MSGALAIRPATVDDAAAICAVYNPYVTATTITFEEASVPVDDMASRIRDVTRAHPWLVATSNGAVAGYAYAGPWRTRSAYRHAVESTVYIAQEKAGRRIGTQLYRALLDALRAGGFHCVMGGIALPNAASVALHESLGFAKVAHFREVGCKLGRRIDVGYWQLML